MFSSFEDDSSSDTDFRDARVATSSTDRSGPTTRARSSTRVGLTTRTGATTRNDQAGTNQADSTDRAGSTNQADSSDQSDLTTHTGPTDQFSHTDQPGPTHRPYPTDRPSPTHQPETSEQDSQYDRAGSPSILGELPAGNSIDNPDQSEPSTTQPSGDHVHDPPVPRHISGRLRRYQAEINMVTEIDNILGVAEDSILNHLREQRELRLERLQQLAEIQPDPVTISEDSSNTGSSEDSNLSLPETRVQGNSESTDEPPAKLRKISSPDKKESEKNDKLNKSDDMDGETCPICLDTWGNSGKHRLVALKCGHLFGAECVERWLKAQTSNNRTCPTCKSRASLRDLRCIYARRLVAADNSEITRLQKQVDILLAQKSRTELQLQTAKMTQRTLAEQLENLKKTIAISQATKQQTERKAWRFALEKNLEICKDGGCRVLTYNCRTYELYVSQKSSNYLFPGYGIRKVSCVDYTLGAFVPLHPKPIRDITYSQPSDLLLSVALDSTARIVQRGMINVTVNAGIPLWSCAWDLYKPNQFYVGGVGGVINQYDFRNPSTCLRSLAGTSGDMSPVVSMCSTEYGLLTCQLNSCWLWESNGGIWEPRAFPVTGAFMSMCYDSESQKALVSMRPKGAERSKLTVCSLSPRISGGTNIEVDQVINGSARTSVMSRATFCKTQGASWVAAHSESDATLYLHGLDGSRTMSLPAAEPALDVCSVQINGSCVLAALSESRLRIYKAHSLGN
ncbi:hypothetical protein PYW08_012456 [Mythimna loreyi]|uniref:Uncharacterized protein n=1 Tax=Mythimna loreyi TaxID=667449 RepID=A0ACC2Q3U7_9NEOP|nr:hypothetical protein PYW08_012456 [Mythimna loreyi]